MKKKQSLLLACLPLLLLSACVSGGEEAKSQQASEATQTSHTGKAIDDEGVPLLEKGRLHEVKVGTTGPELVKRNGEDVSTDYVIYSGSDTSAGKAAAFISLHLGNCTGASFQVKAVSSFKGEVTEQTKAIFVGCDEIRKSCGVELPSRKFDSSTYYIKSYKNSVFLSVKHPYGYQHAALAFCRAVVGYEMISGDTVIYEKDGSILPEMEIFEAPDFEQTNYTNWVTDTAKYGLGFTMDYPFIPVNGAAVHNSLKYLPLATYQKDHPKWYSNTYGKYQQICYTAHGDEEELNAMVDTAYASLEKAVDQFPNRSLVTFTSEDAPSVCTCDACLEQTKKDGSESGAVIRFINKLDDKLQAHLQEEADKNGTEKRTVHLMFFAYQGYLATPSTTVEQDPTLKCNDDVMVYIAPIAANYTYTFYDSVNAGFAKSFIDWSNYASNICAWFYETNYLNYMYPYDTYQSMMLNYRFAKTYGTSVMYNEGQRFSNNVTCFGKLKEYLDAKAQFDVNSDYNECTDRFFRHYFRDAAPIMRQYYEELRAYEHQLEANPENGLAGGVYELIGQARYWPKRLLDSWLEMMDQAMKSVEHYQVEDPALYATLRTHILTETLFPRFALCTNYDSYYTSSQLRAMREAFKKDADELGLKEHAEHHEISEMYTSWGLI